ncbi:MAG: type II toxin-antitoxin system MqsA family antitoxin [Dehalococcoidia bacterium]|nr:MAG: type II toxin-antitoxin system MqsA family antitoxin [Dehalococcoidia bacterium]
MKCYTCGGKMEYTITDLPFKVHQHSIIIIKNVPVFQCSNCNEYQLEDSVMKSVDILLSSIDSKVEVEILSFAA